MLDGSSGGKTSRLGLRGCKNVITPIFLWKRSGRDGFWTQMSRSVLGCIWEFPEEAEWTCCDGFPRKVSSCVRLLCPFAVGWLHLLLPFLWFQWGSRMSVVKFWKGGGLWASVVWKSHFLLPSIGLLILVTLLEFERRKEFHLTPIPNAIKMTSKTCLHTAGVASSKCSVWLKKQQR